jgi:hypothetical protein
MKPVLYWGDGMQHKAMRNIFGQGPRHDAATEQIALEYFKVEAGSNTAARAIEKASSPE